MGFGDIPTDYVESVPFSKRCIAVYKGLIIKIIKHSIALAIKEDTTVDGLVKIITILTTKEIQKLMMSKDDIRHKERIVSQLYLFKKDITIFGDRYAKLVS